MHADKYFGKRTRRTAASEARGPDGGQKQERENRCDSETLHNWLINILMSFGYVNNSIVYNLFIGRWWSIDIKVRFCSEPV